jgi:hypothetical protein
MIPQAVRADQAIVIDVGGWFIEGVEQSPGERAVLPDRRGNCRWIRSALSICCHAARRQVEFMECRVINCCSS